MPSAQGAIARTLTKRSVGIPSRFPLTQPMVVNRLGSSTDWLAIPLALPVVRVVRTRTDGPSLNGALAGTGQLQLAFCVLLSAGLLAS